MVDIDKLNYTIALITEFAGKHKISQRMAFVYLERFKGLDFIDEFYDVEHTLSFEEAVDDVTNYCKRMGGYLS